MGLRVEVLTSRYGNEVEVEEVVVVNADGPFDPTKAAPAVQLVPGNLPRTVKAVLVDGPASPGAHVVGVTGGPVMDGDGNVVGEWAPDPADLVGPMFDGCYIDTSDSRFREAIGKVLGIGSSNPFYFAATAGPVALHNRYETNATYQALSR